MAILKKSHFSRLTTQLLLALILGAIFGILLPEWSSFYSFLGTAFIRLISLIILPLVIPTIILSVANSFSSKSFSTILTRSFLYFFLVTTLIIALSVIGAYLTGFGSGFTIPDTNLDSLKGISQHVNLYDYLLSIIPNNIFEALASGSLLPSIIFAILIGLGIGHLGDKATTLTQFLQAWVDALHQVTNFIIKFLPFGIFGFIAEDVATVGLDNLVSLAQFVIGGYIGYAVLALLFFPLLASFFRISYIDLVKKLWDLIVIAFVSGSSSTVLPPLLERLEDMGYNSKTVNIVLPLGYTFNLDGAAVYLSLATVFIANAYDIQFSLVNLFSLVILLSLIRKTAATIPSGAIVVLLAASSQLGLPQEGVAVILAVDFFLNAGRTALNVVGNGLAVAAIDYLKSPETKTSKKLAIQQSSL